MKPPTLFHRKFLIGHVMISMISRSIELLSRVGDWMADFEVNLPSQEKNCIRFIMVPYENNERVPFILSEESRLLYKNSYTRYYEYRNLWIILLQSATVIINRSRNKIVAFTHYNDLKKPKYLEDFMHPLVELLRQNGVYAHHAAAVSYEDRGLLILGKSGQGKTTLSVDLLANGFHFLADDRCFLKKCGEGLEVIGFYEPIRYFPKNVEHIEVINDSKEKIILPESYHGKCQLDLFRLYTDRIIKRSNLVGLVFPEFSPEEENSRIEPMTKGDVLITILPLTMVCFDRTTSKSHFDFSVNLASTLPSIKLIMGKDRKQWHKLIHEYLSSIPQS